MKVVVIGGTGLIGSKLVQKLDARGHEAIAAAECNGGVGLGLARVSRARRAASDRRDRSAAPAVGGVPDLERTGWHRAQ